MSQWRLSCRFVTHAGNARSLPLCSLENVIMAAAEAYAGFRVGDDSLNALLGSRHASLYPPARPPFIICPNCAGLPMYIKDVAPHWSMAKIDFTYECSDCGAEIREMLTTPELN
jgi:hypothetical protein